MQAWRLGSYEIVRPLGEGGMAQVYLARDIRLGRDVAVKVLDRRLAERPGFRERFLREARLAAALDHPNIVPLYDFGETDRLLYLVMPFVSGGSLQDKLRHAPFPVAEVVTYGTQMADALEYAHQRHVVHRDVKPANMLIHRDGRLMLSDFGLAKILPPSDRPAHPRGHPDAGTPEYMAPEQIQGRTDERSDIYGLGVVLYLLLTGRLPFSGPTSSVVMESHLYRLPPEPRTLNPMVTPAMQAVVSRALAKHADDRFQHASELGAALLGALVAGDAEPLPFVPGSAVPPPSLPDITGPHPAMVRTTRVFSSHSMASGFSPGTYPGPGSAHSRVTGAPITGTSIPWRNTSYPASHLPPAHSGLPDLSSLIPGSLHSTSAIQSVTPDMPSRLSGTFGSRPAPITPPRVDSRATGSVASPVSLPSSGSFGQRFWLMFVLALLLISLVAAVLYFTMRDSAHGMASAHLALRLASLVGMT